MANMDNRRFCESCGGECSVNDILCPFCGATINAENNIDDLKTTAFDFDYPKLDFLNAKRIVFKKDKIFSNADVKYTVKELENKLIWNKNPKHLKLTELPDVFETAKIIGKLDENNLFYRFLQVVEGEEKLSNVLIYEKCQEKEFANFATNYLDFKKKIIYGIDDFYLLISYLNKVQIDNVAKYDIIYNVLTSQAKEEKADNFEAFKNILLELCSGGFNEKEKVSLIKLFLKTFCGKVKDSYEISCFLEYFFTEGFLYQDGLDLSFVFLEMFVEEKTAPSIVFKLIAYIDNSVLEIKDRYKIISKIISKSDNMNGNEFIALFNFLISSSIENSDVFSCLVYVSKNLLCFKNYEEANKVLNFLKTVQIDSKTKESITRNILGKKFDFEISFEDFVVSYSLISDSKVRFLALFDLCVVYKTQLINKLEKMKEFHKNSVVNDDEFLLFINVVKKLSFASSGKDGKSVIEILEEAEQSENIKGGFSAEIRNAFKAEIKWLKGAKLNADNFVKDKVLKDIAKRSMENKNMLQAKNYCDDLKRLKRHQIEGYKTIEIGEYVKNEEKRKEEKFIRDKLIFFTIYAIFIVALSVVCLTLNDTIFSGISIIILCVLGFIFFMILLAICVYVFINDLKKSTKKNEKTCKWLFVFSLGLTFILLMCFLVGATSISMV